jgi:hypothetical protein
MTTLGIIGGVVGIAIITGFFAAGGEKIWDKIFPDEPEDKSSSNATSGWDEPEGGGYSEEPGPVDLNPSNDPKTPVDNGRPFEQPFKNDDRSFEQPFRGKQ